MKKLITSFFLLLAVTFYTQAQVAWDKVRVTPYPYTQHIVAGSDTVYFSMINRSTGGTIAALPKDSVSSLTNVATYVAPDSIVWRIVKGASIGTTPAVRFINTKNGKYLYMGKKGGTTKRLYMSDYVDPYNGSKDFTLTDKGQRVNAEYYYNIVDNEGSILNHLTATSTISYGAASNTGVATYMFRFYSKKGTLPKAALPAAPALGLSVNETSYGAGSSITLNARVTKGTADLQGATLLYHGTTLLDTLKLDANGTATRSYPGLIYGTEKFTLVYKGDANYTPNDSTLTLTVGPNPNAKATKVAVSIPATSELYKEVTLNVATTTTTGDVVPAGYVVLYVNGVAKNKITLDVLGAGSVTFPNLLTGTTNFKALYVGDKMAYLDSDTARTSINVTASTTTAKPYPVYFDLCNQPEIRQWNYKYPFSSTTYATYVHSFPQDSLPGITMSISTALVKYAPVAMSYTATDYKDCYNHADNIQVPLGSTRSTWINFKTPWLNEGAYNVYISQRVNRDAAINISSLTLDDKESYYPNYEGLGRWFTSWGTNNVCRRWNAKGHSGSMGEWYMGSVRVDKSDVHNLKFTVVSENGVDNVTLDMLQFIPVDQDSLTINRTLAASIAKVYYPLFDLGAYARNAGETAVMSFADLTEMALPYQVTDPTIYTTKSVTLDTCLVLSDPNVYSGLDYVTVYRKDKITRMAQGVVTTNTDGTHPKFICNLPDGEYYFEEINYIENSLVAGSLGARNILKSGKFNVGVTAINNPATSDIFAYSANRTLYVKGLNAGDKVTIYDITGKIISNNVATSDIFSKSMNAAMYIVKAVSEKNGTRVMKVTVRQ